MTELSKLDRAILTLLIGKPNPDNWHKLVANFLINDLLYLLNRDKCDIAVVVRGDDYRWFRDSIAEILILRSYDYITVQQSKELLESVWQTSESVVFLLQKHGMLDVAEHNELESVITELIAANSKVVEDYRSGKKQSISFLIGQAMKHFQGKANPKEVKSLIEARLG